MNLYLSSPAYETGFYDTGDGHNLYYERHGNPDGAKAVYLHGGPGAGCGFYEQRLFDPDYFDLLIFDQRGAGKSTPHGKIENNSIDHLVQDLEDMREHFGIKKWSVCGGSWGSALSMFYAAKYPDAVERMILRGVFFGDKKGADYINGENGNATENANAYFDIYKNLIPTAEREKGLGAAYAERVLRGQSQTAIEAAKRFIIWNTSIDCLEHPAKEIEAIEKDPKSVLPLSRIWYHFCENQFDDKNREYLLKIMGRLEIPVHIIHGRQDYICPAQNAKDLHAVCQHSDLEILEQCGHSQKEPPLIEAFIKITKAWRG